MNSILYVPTTCMLHYMSILYFSEKITSSCTNSQLIAIMNESFESDNSSSTSTKTSKRKVLATSLSSGDDKVNEQYTNKTKKSSKRKIVSTTVSSAEEEKDIQRRVTLRTLKGTIVVRNTCIVRE